MITGLKLAATNGLSLRSLKVAIVVGTALNLINQYDAVFGDSNFSMLKAALTYCVPFCVATYGAVMAMEATES
ncbi:nitrate/nitrite transporter NrtS [Lentibacter algarum]|uniref:nitrate/nitrite transporter NrtS n=1 Tax=Lentibacter algarum TaxID=576131 RepID=UPI001C0930D8|nr:nitrate/nitrite transporter NrtS [Lentibacter algarum]